MRQRLGHDGPPTDIWRENLISGAPLTECPLRTLMRAEESQPALYREVMRHWDEHYPNYEAKLLLNAGGMADQPARYLAFMMAIRDVRAAQQAKFEELNPTGGA